MHHFLHDAPWAVVALNRRRLARWPAHPALSPHAGGALIVEETGDRNVLGVAKSAFYAWQSREPSGRAQADQSLTDEIKDIYDDSRCTYGAPRVHAELRRRGKRVARLMRKAGLVGRCPRRFRRTTIADPTTEVQDLVQRQFRPTAPNQLWVSDISYIRTWEGWLYLAVILDAFSRKVVGWALADHLRTELATAALQMALTSRRPPPGLIHHSDRGTSVHQHHICRNSR